MVSTTINGAVTRVLETARAAHQAGFSAIRMAADGSKIPVGEWKPFQSAPVDASDLEGWFTDTPYLLGLACGYGGLEVIDIDDPATNEVFLNLVREQTGGGDLLDRLYIEATPRGGLHLLYRFAVDDDFPRNQKLAQRQIGVDDRGKPILTTLIETRAMGGAVLIAPSPSYTAIQHTISNVPTITADERDLLVVCARSLTEFVEPERIYRSNAAADPDRDRPGDDYNQRGDIVALLERHGWTWIAGDESDQRVYLRRPGKDSGSWSATFHNDLRLLYAFSSNAYPFDPDRAYAPFAIYTLLDHCGDFHSAAAALAADGYGDPDFFEMEMNVTNESAAETMTIQPEDTNAAPSGALPSAPVPTSSVTKKRRRAVVGMQAVTTSAKDVEERAIDWTWQKWSARDKLIVVAGEGGVGKTTLLTDLAATLSIGGRWPDGTQAPVGRTLFICAEDDEADVLKPALRVAGADMGMIEFLTGVEVTYDDGTTVVEPFNLGRHMQPLEDKIATGGFTWVIIDPLNDVLPARVNINNPLEYRAAMQPLKELAKAHHVTVFCVAHLNKTLGLKATHRVGGTEAIVSSARLVWMVAEVPDSDDGVNGPRRVLQVVKSNLSLRPKSLEWNRPENGAINWLGESSHDVDALLNAPVPGHEQTNETGVELKVISVIKQHGPATATRLAPVLEKSEEATRRYLGRLVERGILVRVERGLFDLAPKYQSETDTGTGRTPDTAGRVSSVSELSECPEAREHATLPTTTSHNDMSTQERDKEQSVDEENVNIPLPNEALQLMDERERNVDVTGIPPDGTDASFRTTGQPDNRTQKLELLRRCMSEPMDDDFDHDKYVYGFPELVALERDLARYYLNNPDD